MVAACLATMESGAQPGRRLDGLRKRTLEDRKSSGEEFVLPAKQRECDDEKEEYASKARLATIALKLLL